MRKQQLYLLFFLIFIIAAAGCANKAPLPPEDAELRELCKKSGYHWMAMRPMEKGEYTSKDACFGCMVGLDHICDKEKLKAMVQPSNGTII